MISIKMPNPIKLIRQERRLTIDECSHAIRVSPHVWNNWERRPGEMNFTEVPLRHLRAISGVLSMSQPKILEALTIFYGARAAETSGLKRHDNRWYGKRGYKVPQRKSKRAAERSFSERLTEWRREFERAEEEYEKRRQTGRMFSL